MTLPVALAAEVTIDSTTWAALALVLTAVGAAWTWLSWRRRGPAAALRALAWTLVPVAAWLTGTLRLAANIVEDVLNWATRLVFSPSVWAGVVVAGAAVVCWVVSGFLLGRGIGVRTAGRERAARRPVEQASAKEVPASARTKKAPKARKDDDLDDMSDIEAILKRHGI
jgi:hypothetical protein